MRASRGSAAGLDFFEEPDQGDAEETHKGNVAEDIDEGIEAGLLEDLLVDLRVRAGGSLRVAKVTAEIAVEGVGAPLEPIAGLRDGSDDLVLMELGAASDHGLRGRDSDGAADIAEQVEDAAGVSDFLVAQRGVTLRGDGDEDEAEGEAGDDDGPEKRPGADAEVDVAEGERHESEDDEAEGEQVARVHLVGEHADDGHGHDGAESARANDDAGGEGGVAEQLLIVEREQGDGGVDRNSEEKDEQAADGEVAVAEDTQADDGGAIAPAANDKPGEGQNAEEDGPAQPDGPEPVIFLALVEDDLQAACPDGKQAEADVVELARLGVLDVGRVVDKAADHEDSKDADGDVDVEGVAPAVRIGKPAAERGTDDGSDNHPKAEDGHCGSAHARRKTFQQDGLGQRLERAATGALNDAGKQDETEGGRGSAEEGRDGEDDDAGDKEALASELEGKPVAGGKDDGVGDQVAGQDPGGFVGRGGERSGNVGEGDGGNGGVEHLHKGRQHDGNGNKPRIYARILGLLSGEICHFPRRYKG